MTTAYVHGKIATITNDNQIKEVMNLSIQQILKAVGKWMSEGSGWIIESVDNHYLNIVKYIPIIRSLYIKLPPKLQNSAKDLNLKTMINECFRWCHVRFM